MPAVSTGGAGVDDEMGVDDDNLGVDDDSIFLEIALEEDVDGRELVEDLDAGIFDSKLDECRLFASMACERPQ